MDLLVRRAIVFLLLICMVPLFVNTVKASDAQSGNYYCGPKALNYWLVENGTNSDINSILQLVGMDSRFGSSMLQLEKVAKNFIPSTESVSIELNDLISVLPAIAYLGEKDSIGHFVVINEIKNDAVSVYDPSNDEIISIEKQSFASVYSGISMVADPAGRNILPDSEIEKIYGKMAWLNIAARGSTIVVTLGQRVIQFASHNAHHFFEFLGRKAPHFQINTWIQHVKNSGRVIRIPWFW